MPYESRSLEIKESFPGVFTLKTLRVTEHERPEFVCLEILSVRKDGRSAEKDEEPVCGMVVDVGVLRGFLTWLRDGD